ncbi:MAG: GAF and ANTAR domain-containing protein [Lapillicoccus sp.]
MNGVDDPRPSFVGSGGTAAKGGGRMGSDRVTDILADLAVAQRTGRVSLPQLLCERCRVAVPADAAAMTLWTSTGLAGLVGAAGEQAHSMEDLQLVTGEGPCSDASTSGRPVLQAQLRRTASIRWPGFGPAALEAGVEAAFAFPVQLGAIRMGVLALYRTRPGDLTDVELREALGFADAAVRVLLHLQDQMPLDDSVHPGWSDPAQHQARIHQASGMVAVQAGVGLAEAFLLLRGRAYSSERPLVDVAVDVLARTLQFGAGTRHNGGVPRNGTTAGPESDPRR